MLPLAAKDQKTWLTGSFHGGNRVWTIGPRPTILAVHGHNQRLATPEDHDQLWPKGVTGIMMTR